MINTFELEAIVSTMEHDFDNGLFGREPLLRILRLLRTQSAKDCVEERLISLSIFSDPHLMSLYALIKENTIELENVLQSYKISPVHFAMALGSYVCNKGMLDGMFLELAWRNYRKGNTVHNVYLSTMESIRDKLAVFYD